MNKIALAVVHLAAASVAFGQTTLSTSSAPATQSANNVDLPRYPSVSPDGSVVTFAWRGDLWRVDTRGGPATRLTSNPQEDNFSVWSPDGKQIAFTSERDGGGNVFVMNADGSQVHKVSGTDRYFVVSGWTSRDGITLNARLENDSFPGLRSYALSPSGGEPKRLFDAFGATPVVSPDGSKILFTRGGFPWWRRGYRGPDARDVWMFDRTKNAYTQITKWPGNDGRAKWVDDRTIVYASDQQDGTLNLYELSLGQDASTARRLTKFNGVDIDEFDVSRDGRTLVFASWDRLYRLDLTTPDAAPTPIDITAEQDRDGDVSYRSIDRSVSESALSPDGKTMAVVAFGQVYVRGTEKNAATRRVNSGFGRCANLEWSPDGSTLFFKSDENPKLGNAIYAATVTLSRSDVKKSMGLPGRSATTGATSDGPAGAPPTAGRRRPTVRPAAPGELPVDGADELQAATQAAPEPTLVPGDPTTVPHVEPTVKPSDPTATPLPVGPSTTPAATVSSVIGSVVGWLGGSTQPSTQAATTASAEENATGRWPDAIRFDVRPFITADKGVSKPSVSPDGKRIAYQRGGGQLVVRDLSSGVDHLLVDGWSEQLDWRWSPDSARIAYVTEDRNNNADVFIVPADGSAKAVNISRHPDNDYAPRWSADGKVLAFLSERNDNEADVYAVYLDRSLEALTGVDLDQYYRDAAEKARKRERPKKLTITSAVTPATTPTTATSQITTTTATTAPSERQGDRRSETEVNNGDATSAPASTQASTSSSATSAASAPTSARATKAPSLDLDDAYLRLRRLTALPGSESDLELTPAGDKIVFTAQGTGGRATYVVDREAAEPRRIAGNVTVEALTFEGDKAVVVEGGRAGTLNLATGQLEYAEVSDRLAVDARQLNEQKFREAARILGATYYDETMNGLDWPALTERYARLIRKTITADEFDQVANKFLGELNGSHLGIHVPDAANPDAILNGRLGIVARRSDAGDVVTKVYDNGPAAKGAMKLEVGDVIIAVEGAAFNKHVPLEGMFANRVGKETLVTVRRAGREVNLLLTPITAEAESAFAYDQWRRETADKVAKLSGGKLGYIHIRGMDQISLDAFERDLFAAADGKQGLLIDVRNNGGGWTTDRLLASIMSPAHAYTVTRGDHSGATDGYPQDRLFIQRYTLPIDMLCNEKSFSNAEIVSHAFKTLKRGHLVGQQTAGGVISTGATTLLDGTSVRLPNRGWYLPDGTNMELHGAVPDVLVPQTPEAESRDDDEQLKAAVDDLLKRLK